MEIVIDIEQELYEEILSRKYSKTRLEKAVANGTPLPKHGRLIDVDALREDFKASKKISFAERMDISCIVDHAPTIIEGSESE